MEGYVQEIYQKFNSGTYKGKKGESLLSVELRKISPKNNPPPVRMIPCLLNICPVGDGQLYESFVLMALKAILGNIIDHELCRLQFPINGGHGDIELPFCSESLPDYPCWHAWHRDYGIKSIIVEVKNLAKEASPEDARQIKGYLDLAKKGRFGKLISRNGFSKDALKALRSYANDNTLILPLDHNDLVQLIRLRLQNPKMVSRYLRRKETLLLRIR